MRAGPILVVTGPPGAGKTTVAHLVAESLDLGVHLRADTFWHFVVGGFIPPWQPESHTQNTVVGDAVHAAAVELARGGYTVVLDGIVFLWSLERLINRAWADQVDVHYVVLRPDRATCLARAIARGDGELTDEGPVTQLYGQFADLGWYERHVLDTTGDTPADTAKRIVAEALPVIEIIGEPETDKLLLVEPDHRWPERFADQRDRLAVALGDLAVRIDHVGSTAVPDLPAKPIIDV